MRRNFRIIYSWIATGALTVGLGTGVLVAMSNGAVGLLSSSPTSSTPPTTPVTNTLTLPTTPVTTTSTVAVHQGAPVIAQSSATTTSWTGSTVDD
jgi:hypothetical protein